MAAAILVPGLHISATAWRWAAWIVAGTAGWLLAAVLGAVSGVRLAATVRDAAGLGPIPLALAARLRHPLLVSSWLAWAAIAAPAAAALAPSLPGAAEPAINAGRYAGCR